MRTDKKRGLNGKDTFSIQMYKNVLYIVAQAIL